MSIWAPSVAYPFQDFRQAAGEMNRLIALPGLSIELEGMSPAAGEFVSRRFRRYLVGEPHRRPDLRLHFRRDDHAPFMETRPDGRAPDDYRMGHAVVDHVLYHASGRVCARVDLGAGQGVVLWREPSGTLEYDDPIHMAIENLLRSCLAWMALDRGGFLFHAASIIRGGRCYLFFGQSGAGKSTIASLAGEAVISDDLTLVLPVAGGFEAVGTPFRGTYAAGEDLTGRYPVAGLYRLVKDDRVYLERRPRWQAFSDFLANLPFVVSEAARVPEVWQRAEALFSLLSVSYLHFRKDASFWPAIDAWTPEDGR